jgi:flagellar hook-associated protein 2
MASLSTLGLGSSGVLSNDLLDQLKEADASARIKPIERNQESLKLQQTGLKSIKDLITELGDLSTKMSDETIYKNTKTDVTGDSVTIKASENAKEQTIKIDVEQLATKSIKQSYKKFQSKDELVGAGTMGLSIGGTSYSIDITETDTLQDVADKISAQTDGKIEASILNIGGDKPYKLILKSKESGEKNEITDDGNGINFGNVAGGTAQDAKLRMDGVLITRDNNTFDDLIDNVSITLDKVGQSKIEIKQDNQNITDNMSEFVDKYNETIELISNLTSYDAEKKVGAVLQGSSEIRGISSQLRDIFSTTISSDGKSAEDFGLKADKRGIITLDKDKFQESLKNSPDEIKNFFVGEGESKGIFRKFNSELFNIGTSSSGPLKSLKANYDDKSKSLIDSLEKAQKSLDNKYEIMQRKFAAYDAVIGKLKNSSDYLNSVIEAQYKK